MGWEVIATPHYHYTKNATGAPQRTLAGLCYPGTRTYMSLLSAGGPQTRSGAGEDDRSLKEPRDFTPARPPAPRNRNSQLFYWEANETREPLSATPMGI